MKIINICLHSKKGGKFKSGAGQCVSIISKNPIWGIFLRKGAKKKEYELILKNVIVEFEFALIVENIKFQPRRRH